MSNEADAVSVDEKIAYMYDFSDCWQHILTIEGRSTPSIGIVCIDGLAHRVAEDAKRPGQAELKEGHCSNRPNRE